MPVAAGGAPKYLLAVHDHCHAPTCLSMEMWNNDTGALLCRQRVLYGGRYVLLVRKKSASQK